jgi:hypothetical protein
MAILKNLSHLLICLFFLATALSLLSVTLRELAL